MFGQAVRSVLQVLEVGGEETQHQRLYLSPVTLKGSADGQFCAIHLHALHADTSFS